MVVEWLCPGLRPTRSNRPRLLHCKVILLDEHELLQDILVSSGHDLPSTFSQLFHLLLTVLSSSLILSLSPETQDDCRSTRARYRSPLSRVAIQRIRELLVADEGTRI